MELTLTPALLFAVILGYFALLLGIGIWTGKDDSNANFFLGNRSSPWYVVAYGMIGGSLSGVSFISLPGKVASDHFAYMQIVFGYLLGYLVIAFVLMPLYYRLNLPSIYGYLRERFGPVSYRTGSAFFILSRTLGAALRLFIGAMVIYDFVFVHWGVPFWVTVVGSLALIWLYTFRGGIKTIVWTDTFQTTCLLVALLATIWAVGRELGLGIWDMPGAVARSEMSQIFVWDNPLGATNHFLKHFFGGMFIAVAMTGLDQDMMQKNLTCRNLWEGQKNVLSFASVLVFVNFLILGVGALLYMYVQAKGIPLPDRPDKVYPVVALLHLSPFIGLVFAIGLISTAYASADSALTALTTSFCVDFLGFKTEEGQNGRREHLLRHTVHFGFSLVMLLAILVFAGQKGQPVIDLLFKIANFTYGPLLGLFAFGLFTRRTLADRWSPLVCLVVPVGCYFLDQSSVQWLGGYRFGNELLILNGLLTFFGLWAISRGEEKKSFMPQEIL
jgi:Na+/proline symporter